MQKSRNLPVELFRTIFLEIDNSHTLTLLALVCRSFLFEADRILYSEAPKKPGQIRHVKFLDTLVREPRLATFVRRYVLPHMAGGQRTSCWTLLRLALPMMVNLKELSITGFANELEVLPMHKMTCDVEKLTWIQVDYSPKIQLWKWIESQKRTKHLRWIHRGHDLDVSRSVMPNLASLEGNIDVIRAFLPGRKIQHLSWIGDFHSNGTDVSEELSLGLQKIKTLSIENSSLLTNEYNILSRHFTSLKFLELTGCHEAIIHTISIPPNLKILVFSMSLWSKHEPSANREGAMKQLLQKGSHLSVIYISLAETPTELRLYYEHWGNDGRYRGLVHGDVVREPIIIGHGK